MPRGCGGGAARSGQSSAAAAARPRIAGGKEPNESTDSTRPRSTGLTHDGGLRLRRRYPGNIGPQPRTPARRRPPPHRPRPAAAPAATSSGTGGRPHRRPARPAPADAAETSDRRPRPPRPAAGGGHIVYAFDGEVSQLTNALATVPTAEAAVDVQRLSLRRAAHPHPGPRDRPRRDQRRTASSGRSTWTTPRSIPGGSQADATTSCSRTRCPTARTAGSTRRSASPTSPSTRRLTWPTTTTCRC